MSGQFPIGGGAPCAPYVGGGGGPHPKQDTKTLRDEFAMAALPRFLRSQAKQSWSLEEVCEKAYMVADAMMKAREQK